MRGFLHHFRTTLVLNCRNRQALIFGYAVPIFFLIAFAAIFGGKPSQVGPKLGELLTINAMGGACFGMAITMVGERERGVWRRYRLTPLSSGAFVLSTVLARYLIILSSMLLQFTAAKLIYGVSLPLHPFDLFVAVSLTAIAFIGIGLVIASVASSVGAVQALSQSLFLPMIMIGGVGVPIESLKPLWMQDVSLFLPGRYAVEAIQRSCTSAAGIDLLSFRLLALLVIGAVAVLAGWKLFRWEPGERLRPSAWAWLAFVIAAWLCLGAVSMMLKPA